MNRDGGKSLLSAIANVHISLDALVYVWYINDQGNINNNCSIIVSSPLTGLLQLQTTASHYTHILND